VTHRPMFRPLTAGVCLAAAFTLASCGKPQGVVNIPNCPAAGLVAHTASLTRFNGEGETSGDAAFDATITDLDYKCVEGSSAVETTVSFSIIARKGPALQNPVQEVRYFVAVLRDDYQITNKRTFTTQLKFTPGKDTTGVRETVVQRFDDINVPKRYRYEILIGFELSPEEIKFTTIR
jgi:hypothetical protein